MKLSLLISTHRVLWESVSQFTNALSYVDIDDLHDDNGEDSLHVFPVVYCVVLLKIIITLLTD